MTKKEFCLSNEINKEGGNTWGCKYGFLDVEDVKEFIKKLKEMKGIEHDGSFISCVVIRAFIDKLAGDKLI